MIAVLMAALGAIWWQSGRSVAALGLDWPIGTGGWIGLAIALLLVVVLAIAAVRMQSTPPLSASKPTLPRGAAERRWYILFAFAAGIGWEVLYRGYLWWALTPVLGAIGAIAVMGTAYGVAHGYRGLRPFAGALISALLFATGYALTQSLWWLIVIHIALPLFGLAARPHDDPPPLRQSPDDR